MNGHVPLLAHKSVVSFLFDPKLGVGKWESIPVIVRPPQEAKGRETHQASIEAIIAMWENEIQKTFFLSV